MRAGGNDATTDLVQLIRSGIDLSSLAAYVRNEVRANFAVEHSFHDLDFTLDGTPDLPSPTQLLNRHEQQQVTHHRSESVSGHSSYSTDPSLNR